jgi:hypothetical protein
MEVELRYDPIPYILTRGAAADVLSLLDEAGLGASSIARQYMLALISRQRRDGGFPYVLEPAHSGVRETARAVRLLLEGGMGRETLNVNAALEWLLEMRRPDGSWSENPAVTLPSSEIALSTTQGVSWLTAEVARTFQAAGVSESVDAYWAALDWLYNWQHSDGGWPLRQGEEQSDVDSSTLITFLLADVYGERDPVVEAGLAFYERNLTEVARDAQQRYYEVRGERRGLDVYHLVDTVLEPEAAAAGYGLGDPRVMHIVEALVDIQRRDGGWRPFWREESDPGYTVYTLRAMVWVGALERDELAEMVQRYLR